MKHSLRNYLMFIPVIALRVPLWALILTMRKIGDAGDWIDRNLSGRLPYLDVDLEKEKARRDAMRKIVIDRLHQ